MMLDLIILAGATTLLWLGVDLAAEGQALLGAGTAALAFVLFAFVVITWGDH